MTDGSKAGFCEAAKPVAQLPHGAIRLKLYSVSLPRYSLPECEGGSYDIAGVVTATGPGAPAAQDDEIFGIVDLDFAKLRRDGCEIVLAEQTFGIMPRSLNFHQAATLPSPAAMLYAGLARVHPKPFDRILLLSPDKGLGSLAACLARRYKADLSVCDMIPSEKLPASFDIIIDMIGANGLLLRQLARPDAHILISRVPNANELAPIFAAGLSLHALRLPSAGEGLARLLDQVRYDVDRMSISPMIDPEPFTLDRLDAARRKQKSGRAQGHVVIALAH